jgi:hypothetical protein
MSQETHLSELEEEMAQAVASEDFETAAALRDQIDQIRRDQRIMEQPERGRAPGLVSSSPGAGDGWGWDQPVQLCSAQGLGPAPEARPDDDGTFKGRGGVPRAENWADRDRSAFRDRGRAAIRTPCWRRFRIPPSAFHLDACAKFERP